MNDDVSFSICAVVYAGAHAFYLLRHFLFSQEDPIPQGDGALRAQQAQEGPILQGDGVLRALQ